MMTWGIQFISIHIIEERNQWFTLLLHTQVSTDFKVLQITLVLIFEGKVEIHDSICILEAKLIEIWNF